jgi:hypothetical protein
MTTEITGVFWKSRQTNEHAVAMSRVRYTTAILLRSSLPITVSVCLHKALKYHSSALSLKRSTSVFLIVFGGAGPHPKNISYVFWLDITQTN